MQYSLICTVYSVCQYSTVCKSWSLFPQYHTIVKGALDLLIVFVSYSEVADYPTPRSSPRGTPDHTLDGQLSTARTFKNAVETVASKESMEFMLGISCVHSNMWLDLWKPFQIAIESYGIIDFKNFKAL